MRWGGDPKIQARKKFFSPLSALARAPPISCTGRTALKRCLHAREDAEIPTTYTPGFTRPYAKALLSRPGRPRPFLDGTARQTREKNKKPSRNPWTTKDGSLRAVLPNESTKYHRKNSLGARERGDTESGGIRIACSNDVSAGRIADLRVALDTSD